MVDQGYEAKTQHCIELVETGESEWQLDLAGCNSRQSDAFDWRAVQEAKREYQQRFEEKTDQCRDLALEGAEEFKLMLQGCDDFPTFGNPTFDQSVVDEAQREYDLKFQEQTQRCVKLALQGADSATMMLSGCDQAQPGLGTDFDQREVDQAEDEWQRHQRQDDIYCDDSTTFGNSTWPSINLGCDNQMT